MMMAKQDMNTKAMYKLSYGLFVCTAVQERKMNGCISNTVIQIASEPNTISVAINKQNYTHYMKMTTHAAGFVSIINCTGITCFLLPILIANFITNAV